MVMVFKGEQIPQAVGLYDKLCTILPGCEFITDKPVFLCKVGMIFINLVISLWLGTNRSCWLGFHVRQKTITYKKVFVNILFYKKFLFGCRTSFFMVA